MSKHDHYFFDVSAYDKVDIYRLIEIIGITCPVAQHVFKKAAVAGQRGHKDLERDWSDMHDSAARKLAMLKEDEKPMKWVLYANGVPGEPETDPRWVEGEKRMEQIGPNGPTAEHYTDPFE